MRRKFLEGLVFGAGFAIAYLAIGWLTSVLLMPLTIRSGPPTVAYSHSDPPFPSPEAESGPPFHELPVDEQIQKASVIALARYEPATDGRMKAVISEILKQEPDTTFYYAVGDEFADGSFYTREGTGHGDGLVIFFVGSPATMTMSMTYSGDRIRSLGDIPLKLFREKCEPGAVGET